MRNRCIIPGCGRIVHGRGLCKTHYLRDFRHGSPFTLKRFVNDPVAAFWSRVNKEGIEHPDYGRCWVWIGAKSGLGGYGGIVVRGVQSRAHRYSWEIHNGEIPAGKHILHRCDNPTCVRPEHLFLGDDVTNVADKVSKGRQARLIGEQNPLAILDDGAVKEIRTTYKPRDPFKGREALARMFGVSVSAIKAVLSGRNWRHLT